MRYLLLTVMCAVALAAGCEDDPANNGGSADGESDIRERDVVEDVADDVGEDTEDSGDDGGDAEDVDDGGDAQEDVVEDVQDVADTVDAADSSDGQGDVEADGDADETAEGDTCDVAVDVTAGGTFDSQTTVGFTDDYSADATADNCPSGSVSGPDVVYSVTPTAETTYTFTVQPEGSTFDPFIYLRSDCSQQACLDGTVFNGPGEQESLQYTVAADETVFVIVDGELVSEGDFTLTVEVQ